MSVLRRYGLNSMKTDIEIYFLKLYSNAKSLCPINIIFSVIILIFQKIWQQFLRKVVFVYQVQSLIHLIDFAPKLYTLLQIFQFYVYMLILYIFENLFVCVSVCTPMAQEPFNRFTWNRCQNIEKKFAGDIDTLNKKNITVQ